MKRLFSITILTSVFVWSALAVAADSLRRDVETVTPGSAESAPIAESIPFAAKEAPFLSEIWRRDFAVPPRAFRPLQIVHGRDLTDPKTVEYFRDQCGLGGLVVNVGGEGYIRSEENWARFLQGVRNLKDAGMRVWIYDEDGYPSLSAGGVVLENHPELRAKELAYDPEHDPPFFVRDCYEFTHSSNNVFRARRYPNPLDPEATKRFLDVTHRRYRDTLKDLYEYVEAFFTDEPSMMAANLGIIQEEHIRSRVPTEDPLDPDKKCVPVVSWCDDLEDRYREAYGEDLRPHLQSLFTGDDESDKKVRRQFWSLLGELDRERYYGQIRDFCHETPKGPVASGHTLYEENLIMHVPLDGNKIEILKTFDLPGMDMLNSDPVAYYYGCWEAAAFPCSAANFIGKRRVMTEISDFSQLNVGDRKPVDLATMEAAAGWQASFGVTEFTLYYGIGGAEYRNEESHRNYCRFVGRLNAILRDAVPVRPILLYYPIEEMQSEFKPVAEKYGVSNQSQRAGEIISSFDIIGAGLSRIQTSFCVIDRKTLKSLTTTPEDPKEAARLRGKYRGVIFPRHSDPIDYEWADPNFKEYRASEDVPFEKWEDVARELGDFAGPRLTPTPEYPSCIEGAFEREGRYIFVVTNAVLEPWQGTFKLTGVEGTEFETDRWTLLDPKSGAIETFASDGSEIRADFAGRQTLVFVSPKRK
ncbi:MAG: hypothetical protein IJU03_05330 [Thermoguttaceae bacterium]|nr:hypothetical protein [Thermoguttaceae bacterium]